MAKTTKKTGPQPERLKLAGDWEKMVGKALAKPRPDGGWPKPETKTKKKKSGA